MYVESASQLKVHDTGNRHERYEMITMNLVKQVLYVLITLGLVLCIIIYGNIGYGWYMKNNSKNLELDAHHRVSWNQQQPGNSYHRGMPDGGNSLVRNQMSPNQQQRVQSRENINYPPGIIERKPLQPPNIDQRYQNLADNGIPVVQPSNQQNVNQDPFRQVPGPITPYQHGQPLQNTEQAEPELNPAAVPINQFGEVPVSSDQAAGVVQNTIQADPVLQSHAPLNSQFGQVSIADTSHQQADGAQNAHQTGSETQSNFNVLNNNNNNNNNNDQLIQVQNPEDSYQQEEVVLNSEMQSSTPDNPTDYDEGGILKEKLILLWSKHTKNSFKEQENLFDNCKHRVCSMTMDKSRVSKSDALIFVGHELNDPQNPLSPPTVRETQQHWIFSSKHPLKGPPIPSTFNKVFNRTLTYTHNSDFVYRHFQTKELTEDEKQTVNIKMNYAEGKKRKVAWMVSNCQTDSWREKYAKELANYIQVDIYGKCGPYRCGTGSMHRAGCNAMLGKSYKFYLAFENNLCQDYVTQTYVPLMSRVLPIVLGGANYANIMPRDSYLDVRNFTSPLQLAKYLELLDNDDARYNRYFEWVTRDKVEDGDASPHWCELCEFLHSEDFHGKKYLSYPDINSWFRRCLAPEVYYLNIVNATIKNA